MIPSLDAWRGWSRTASRSLFWAIVLALVYRFARPLIHRLLLGVFRVQEVTLGTEEAQQNELEKRVKTLEDLLSKTLRLGVIVAGIFVIFARLRPVAAAAPASASWRAALTLAGQSIVLDYLMGFLILVEGQYYVGDVINVGGIEGTVEEIGFRRTTIRDTSGTVHSISNGEIRISSNLTRTYASCGRGDPGHPRRGRRAGDRGRCTASGIEVAADPAWSARLLGPPNQPVLFAFTDIGATVRMSCRVVPEDRWRVAAELRKRIATAFTAAGIEPNRRTVAGAGSPSVGRRDWPVGAT